jgi:hypothetical protein
VPGHADSLTLYRQPLSRAQRFYWRVLARNGGDWSDGAHIDAFVAAPATAQHPSVEQAEEVPLGADPVEGEPLGPSEGLFRAAAAQARAQAEAPAETVDDIAHASPQSVEGAEIVTLGMTLLIAGALVLAALLLLLFFAI